MNHSPCTGVAVEGNTGYAAAEGTPGLYVFDVSDPVKPHHLGSCRLPDGAMTVTVSKGIAYVSDSGGGVQLVDVSNPSSPTLIGRLRHAWVCLVYAGG